MRAHLSLSREESGSLFARESKSRAAAVATAAQY